MASRVPDEKSSRRSTPRITALAASTRKPGHVAVRVGRRIVATVTPRQVRQLNLSVGQVWDAVLQSRVTQAATLADIHRHAMSLLNRRAMSTRQLQRKLVARGFRSTAVSDVLSRLAEIGALNDEAFGRALIEETVARKPAGPRLLRVKLRQRGLENALIERLLAASLAQVDMVPQALALARKRQASLARFEAATQKRRLWGLLARRGFDSHVIEQAIGQLRFDEPMD